MNGLTKTIIALLPAVGAHILALFLKDGGQKEEIFMILAIALLIAGGIISAFFLVGAMFRRKPDQSKVLAVFLSIVIVLGYVATFFFTGCLLAVTGMNLVH